MDRVDVGAFVEQGLWNLDQHWSGPPDLRLGERFGDARTDFSDLTVVLGDAALTAVPVCLPHALHAEASVQAAGSGKHVLVEKPIAATLEDADRMIAASEAARVVLMVAETVRFDPMLGRAVELVRDGRDRSAGAGADYPSGVPALGLLEREKMVA